jgi:hypothetical protein
MFRLEGVGGFGGSFSICGGRAGAIASRLAPTGVLCGGRDLGLASSFSGLFSIWTWECLRFTTKKMDSSLNLNDSAKSKATAPHTPDMAATLQPAPTNPEPSPPHPPMPPAH